MRTSVNLSISSPSVTAPSIPAPRSGILRVAIATAVLHVVQAGEAIRRRVSGHRRPGAWRRDLPCGVGMDRLAEQAFPTWIPRG